MFLIISTPGKIIYLRTWNSVEGWVCEELEQVGKYWSGQVLSVDVVFWGREKSLVGKRIQKVLFFLRLFTWERVGMWSRQGQREWERESWPNLLSAEPDGELPSQNPEPKSRVRSLGDGATHAPPDSLVLIWPLLCVLCFVSISLLRPLSCKVIFKNCRTKILEVRIWGLRVRVLISMKISLSCQDTLWKSSVI